MICRLFEFEVDIGKNKTGKLITPADCEHCGGDVCTKSQDVNIKKSHHQFSWYLSKYLEFPEGYPGGLKDGLKLEHAIATPVWICRSETESGDTKFKLFQTNKPTPIICDSIKNVNYQLIKLIDYKGIPICIEDWV